MEDMSDWLHDRPEIEIVGRERRKPTKEEVEKMKQFMWGKESK